MKRLLTIVLALAITGISSSAMAAVLGSPHDYSGGVSTFSLCNPCHVPHAAPSAKRLWAQKEQGTGNAITFADGNTWNTSDIGKLCGSCHHLGMFTINAQNDNGDAPHQVQASVYADASHGRSLTELTGPINDTPTAADLAGRPYMTNWGGGMTANRIQCSSCHDPHNNTAVKPFLRAVGGQTSISDVCAGCHDRFNDANYGTANTMVRGANDGAAVASMHPVDIAYTDQVGNEGGGTVGKESNTILRTQAELPAALRTPLVDPEEWRLGGKFEGTDATGLTGNLGCNTCHAVHGTTNLAGVGSPATNIYLLAVDNNGANGNAPLCESCHGGSSTVPFTSLALQDGTAASNGLHYVAGHQLPTVGLYDDHPLDMTPDGVPALVNWAAAGNARYERIAWGATSAGDPQAADGQWPYGTQGTYSIGGTTFGNIICISCHSAHNGVSNTSLRRKGGVAVSALGNPTANPTAAQMAADGGGIRTAWCYNCHALADMVPAYHHSTNADPANLTPANYTAGDVNGANSAINCTNCHAAATINAHNGFFNLNFAAAPPGTTTNGSSGLCISCHPETDPVSGFDAPNGHILTGGTQSHYIGTFEDGAATTAGDWDINVKRSAWRTNIPYKGGTVSVYSKYGVTAASDATGGTDTHHTAAPAAKTAVQTVICESCHSVLFNAGWDGRPAAQGGQNWAAANGFTQWSLEGGWRTNLLLQLYEDRAPGTGNLSPAPAFWAAGGRGPSDVDQVDTNSGFCVQCHNQNGVPAGIAPLMDDSISAGHAQLGVGNVPQNMHPMTGWTITRALDSGRAITTLVTGVASGTYADAATRPDGGAGFAASYPAANAQDCDSCHRPHKAYGLIPGSPKTGTGVADDVPAILEVGDGTTNVDLVCVSCHNR